jgi:hypothetical protein
VKIYTTCPHCGGPSPKYPAYTKCNEHAKNQVDSCHKCHPVVLLGDPLHNGTAAILSKDLAKMLPMLFLKNFEIKN